MLRDFFIPDNFQKPPTQQPDDFVYESANFAPAWLKQFTEKFMQPAIGLEKGAKAWQQRAAKAWSQVAQEWRNLQFPEAEALLAALAAKTGLSRPMLQEALRNHFGNVRENVLLNWLAQVRKDRGPRNLPLATTYPELIFLVAAGNIPGMAIHPVVQLAARHSHAGEKRLRRAVFIAGDSVLTRPARSASCLAARGSNVAT
jgi:hypothetical protein